MTPSLPRNHGCRLSDAWTFHGLRALVLENELLRVTVLADKGSDIVEFRYKPRDLDFLYCAPGGVRNPAETTVPAATSAPYLDFFSGGWNEILPNGGPTVNYRGAELGQHGEISLLRWDYAIVEDTPDSIGVKLWVRALRTPFLVEKTLSMQSGKPALFIREQVTNESGDRVDFMWGHHIAFGRPFLDEGVVIDAPARGIEVQGEWPDFAPRRFVPGGRGAWPGVPSLDGGTIDASVVPAFGAVQAQEMAYLKDFDAGWYAVTNPARGIGFGVRFDEAVFRYVWYWQQLGNVAGGYPWWKRTHTHALEPWSSYPSDGLNEAIANGTALALAGGESLEAELVAVAYEGAPGVKEILPDGTVLR